jgi:predicted permease
MSAPLVVAALRGLARLLAICYPPQIRDARHPSFADVAEHRWRRERAAAGGSMRAALRTAGVLIGDTAVSAPVCWHSRAERAGFSGLIAFWRAAMFHPFRGMSGDVRRAARLLRQRPTFSLVIVLTLALGIGASTAAFDALDRSILRPLPFANGDRLVFIAMQDRERGFYSTPSADMLARWRQGAQTIERFEVFRGLSATRTGHGPAEVLDMLGISPGLPGMLSVTPVAGRMLGAADAAPDAPRAVMLGEAYWRHAFGASPAAIGTTLQLGATAYTVVGIWPGGARLDIRSEPPDLYRVLQAAEELRQGTLSHILGLARPGAGVAAIESELRSLAAAVPDPRQGYQPAVTAPSVFLGPAYVTGVWLVFGGALALLVVAIVNAGHLLGARASARRLEMGVRLALGGSTTRLVRLLLIEALALAGAGLTAGAGVAALFETLMTRYEPRMFTPLEGAGLFGRALLFAGVAALVAAVFSSIGPALITRAVGVRDVLERSGGSRTTSRRSILSGFLLAGQAALAVVLVTGAALMARSYGNLMAVDTGLAIDELASVSIAVPASRYPTPELQGEFIRRVRAAIETTPGVRRVTTSGMPILNTTIWDGEPHLEGEPAPPADANAITTGTGATPGHLETLGVRLVAGRFFQTGDARAAVVSESFARKRGGQVVGRKLYMPRSKTPYEVIGVAGDVRSFGLSSATQPDSVYLASSERHDTFNRFIMRTSVSPAEVLPIVRARVAEIDANVPLLAPETGPDVVARQTRQHRLVATLLLSLAVLGVVLAMAGVYGRVSLDVSERTREMGVRMALGATTAQVVGAVWRTGCRPVFVGAALGCLLAIGAATWLDALLFGVGARDPLSAAAGVALVTAGASLATMIPARRAGRIDPVTTLRV